MKLSIDDMAAFCKKKGFVYPSAEIYGGLSGFFDFGPLGVEIKNNIKGEWWKAHVTQRGDIVGIDGAIKTNPKVWVASGHVNSFTDILLECSKCREKYRADHLIEDKLKIKTEGLRKEDIAKLIEKHDLKCPKCRGELASVKDYNLMFSTNVGPEVTDSSTAYLRPETAQLIFTNFKLVQENARMKLPFGIAQIGKAFRNEISPRDFLFRSREFEQMELEYFVNPNALDNCPYIDEFMDYEMNVLSAEMQTAKKNAKKMTLRQLIANKIVKTKWQAYWLAFEHKWFAGLGANPDNFRIRQHLEDEKSHYALDTWDLEYNFPFGWKELQGMANRTDFDLRQHTNASKKDLTYYDEESKERIMPYVVAEPSQGVERAFLVFMFDAYEYDKKRENVVLHLHPKLAPYKAAVFPLVSNKPELTKKARKVYDDLKKRFNVFYDESASIGRRYARQDEAGTPLGITVDFDSLKKDDVTIRDRDTTKQVRVKLKDLPGKISEFLEGAKFEKLGRIVK